MTSSIVGQNYLLPLWPELPGNYPSAGPSLLERLGVHASLYVISGKINYTLVVWREVGFPTTGRYFLFVCALFPDPRGEKKYCLAVV